MTLETFHVFLDPVQFFHGLICISASVSFDGVVFFHAVSVVPLQFARQGSRTSELVMLFCII